MLRTWKEFFLDLACQLPGWMFLAIGLTVLALALLAPAYLQNRELTWQRGLQRLQVQRLAEDEAAYRQMLAALDANDPVLLERLAYHYLRLKPAGAVIVGNRPGAPVPASERFCTVDSWLQRPIPRAGQGYPGYSPLQSPIVRVVLSPVRVLLLTGGLLCLALGLIPVSRRRPVMLPAWTARARGTAADSQDRPAVNPQPTASCATDVPLRADRAADVAAAVAGPASLAPVEAVVGMADTLEFPAAATDNTVPLAASTGATIRPPREPEKAAGASALPLFNATIDPPPVIPARQENAPTPTPPSIGPEV